MKVIKLNSLSLGEVISQTISALQAGQLVIYPTETCYGLGADATNQHAIDKLLQFKTRREGKAFSVAVTDQTMAERYVELNQTAKQLYQQFLPGPLTVVSKIKDSKLTPSIERGPRNEVGVLAHGVASEFDTLGIRIPDYSLALSLTKALDKPITATSANVSYQSPPYSLQQWLKQTPAKSQELIDLWLDAGELPRRQPSTVIDTTVDELTILRQGTLKFDAKLEFISRNEDDTYKLADQIITNYLDEILESGLIIGLQGQLGAGKTQFAKGAAQSLGITDLIKSPTFTLMHEYTFRHPEFISGSINSFSSLFYHLDTWRLQTPEEFLNLNLHQLIKPGTLFIIEWVEKISDELTSLTKENHAKLLWGNAEVLDDHTRRWTFSSLQ